MGILVNIVGKGSKESDEYQAACRLKDIIESTAPEKAMGEIVLFPSATLFGQKTKDVDIVMIGTLKNCAVNITFLFDNETVKDTVDVENFCTTIEVKGHPAESIEREGTNWYVKYKEGWHNATEQSNNQKTSLMNFFKSNLHDTPYITNLLWFTSVTSDELKCMQTVHGHDLNSNVMPSNFSFAYLAQVLSQQIEVRKNSRNKFYMGSSLRDLQKYTSAMDLFSKTKSGMGNLTRKKIEQITNTSLQEMYSSDETTEGSVIFRGRAGTGKTIDLIRNAIQLVDLKGARVQILTYNKALVADIRRLFALAELPDMFQEKCVSVNTMHFYFYRLIKKALYNDNLDSADFLNKYDNYLQEMVNFLDDDPDSRNLVNEICQEDPELDWEYIFIDEAQDWSDLEQKVILKLYDQKHLMVADGGQQFIRGITPCDWSRIRNKTNVRLKYCLRQKENIIKFLNHFNASYDFSENKILPSKEMLGGKVLIITDKRKFFDTIKDEKKKLLDQGNIAYDMLFIVTPDYVNRENGDRNFKHLQEFEENGILLWDGTSEQTRQEYAVSQSEARVLQYESVRGLEGWTVCCMDFDHFLEEKAKTYVPDDELNSLFLESPEDNKMRFLLNWAMIPMTRAIDTLIITLKNVDSDVSKHLLQIGKENPDYIEII